MAEDTGSPPEAPGEDPTTEGQAPEAESSVSGRLKAGLKARLGRLRSPFGDRLPLGEMVSALWAKDPATRRMAMLFFLSLFTMAAVLTMAYRRYVSTDDLKELVTSGAEDTSRNLGEFIQKQAQHAKHRVSSFTIGKFTVELKQPPNREIIGRSMNLAELEISVECDSKETRYYMEDNLAKTQDRITSVLASVDRDELLTIEGKKRLKRKIIDRLNDWLPSGKVEDLFFSELVTH